MVVLPPNKEIETEIEIDFLKNYLENFLNIWRGNFSAIQYLSFYAKKVWLGKRMGAKCFVYIMMRMSFVNTSKKTDIS